MKNDTPPPLTLSCPIPIGDYPRVLLAHGGGGKLMHELIEKLFMASFSNPLLDTRHDSAVIHIQSGSPGSSSRLALTTDSFVVQPLFFPGGNIGSLSVHGTVNDLAMSGAQPLYLTAGFIIEEGMAMDMLWQIVLSMRNAAQEAGVAIVTGDTKVVDHGKCDGVYINTTGIGIIEHDLVIEPKSVRKDDVIIINGDIGRHGIAVMSVRENLQFEKPVESDSASVAGIVTELINEGMDLHCMRDLTRGGLASALIEIAESSNTQISIDENMVPVCDQVRGACEILGFDPLYVANEGRFICLAPEKYADKIIDIMHKHMPDQHPTIIGNVTDDTPGRVTIKNSIGTTRYLEMISGEQLPRIC